MKTDVMIDLETLGIRPGCVVLSVGAVEFDRMTGDIGNSFYYKLDIDSQELKGLHKDPQTMQWWSEQTEEARAEVFDHGEKLVSVVDTLTDLREFVGSKPVWGNGAIFDISILEYLSHEFGLGELFKYNQSRDVKTIIDLGGSQHKNDPIHWEGLTPHNALHDAVAQARYTAATIKELLNGN